MLRTSSGHNDQQHVFREDEQRHIYHVTRHMATGLAKNENRKYSAEEERSMSFSTSEVALVFPLDEDLAPVNEQRRGVCLPAATTDD